VKPIEQLARGVAAAFPAASLELEGSETAGASWWLDVRHEARSLNVEWRPHLGFGVTARDDVLLGEGPDEVYRSREDATERVLELLRTGATTARDQPVSLGTLRRSRRVTQSALARRLGMDQPNLARLEGRQDVLMSQLVEVVGALGGAVRVSAVFPDGDERQIQLPANEREAGR
jgi:hypothetical protein